MILIPEQISCLRSQIKTTKENIRSYNDYLSSKHALLIGINI